jgi:predicted SnoaL-like aldol condensation-catalyzing enzyme
MAKSDIEKVLTVFAGISAGDVSLATRYVDHKQFVQHNPYAADGVEGLTQFITQSPRDQLQLTMVRAFQDGRYVVTQGTGQRSGRNVFFDIFRFEHGLIVEHWAFSTEAAPPNESGHTQIDGPTEAKLSEDTDKNKSVIRKYYETVHIAGGHSKIPLYVAADQVRHEPGVRDGLAAFLRDLEVITQHRTIDEIKFVLGQGDFVFVAATGTHQGNPCAYIDLYRVENEKIIEHWGFPEEIPPLEKTKNKNGML